MYSLKDVKHFDFFRFVSFSYACHVLSTCFFYLNFFSYEDVALALLSLPNSYS